MQRQRPCVRTRSCVALPMPVRYSHLSRKLRSRCMNYWPLLGVAVVVLGFALRLNPALVVVAAGVVSALLSGMSVPDLLALLGHTFIGNRMLLLFVLTLPAIGLL